MTTPIPPPDSHHLRAAHGWLGLGNHLEANAELEEISPQLRDHPEVLALRWQIYSLANKWDDALEIARSLVRLVPDDADHWIHRSYALHVLKATAEAKLLLLPAVSRFPKNAVIRYNLACYDCQLGNLAEAKAWLTEMFALEPSKKAKLEALNDPDLEPLWREIDEL